MKTYTFYEDSGHGWLKVPKKELKALGIAEKVSGCSYMHGQYAYLEEDCDASLFDTAYIGKHGVRPKEKKQYSDRSKVRDYDSYEYYTPAQESFIHKVVEKMLSSHSWGKPAIRKIKIAPFKDCKFWNVQYSLGIEV